MSLILGIDLGKFKSVVCSFDRATKAMQFLSVKTDPEYFRELLKRLHPDQVVFETCTIAGWVADLCQEMGIRFDVVNPTNEAWNWRKVKRKTDRDDAQKLALMADRDELPTIPMPSRETREYRTLVKYRTTLVDQSTATRNRIRALCQQHGLLLPLCHRAWTEAGRSLIASHAKPLADCNATDLWRGVLKEELDGLMQLMTRIATIEHQLEAMAASDQRVRLLQTIPGVGRCTAEVVVAYLDDAQRFQNAGQVSAYAGLVPRQFQSGEMDRKGRITRRGPFLMRKMLVEAAWQMQRWNPWAARLMQRISRGQKVRRKQALVAVARKLLVRCWAMLRDGTTWRPEPVATG